eukprot:4766281-Alexandrium_andersonii.AAC.1
MSSRKCCEPSPAQRPSEPSDRARPLGSSSVGSPKLLTSTMPASSISIPAAGSAPSAAFAASFWGSGSPSREASE